MADFLHLPHLRSLNVLDRSDHYEIEAEGDAVPTAFPTC
jgi:hypothetical protein